MCSEGQHKHNLQDNIQRCIDEKVNRIFIHPRSFSCLENFSSFVYGNDDFSSDTFGFVSEVDHHWDSKSSKFSRQFLLGFSYKWVCLLERVVANLIIVLREVI